MGEREAGKIYKVCRQVYFNSGKVGSLTIYFPMPKVEYISMVYNGTLIGLRAALRYPILSLPTLQYTLMYM